MVHINMQTELYIGENGKIISITAKDSINFPMELFIRENGKTISCMELDFMLILRAENGMGNLEMGNFNQNRRNS